MFVKICGITSEQDGLLAVAMGADAVGFVFAPSVRQVPPSLAGDIAKRLPPGIITVGVFRNESPSRVVEIVNGAGLRAAQLHGLETVEECNYVAQRVGMTIKAFPAGHRSIENFSRYGADILLVDGPSPGAGEVFDWRLAEGVVDSTRLMVSGGLDASNVGDAIWHLHPWGVDVSTGVESSPGVKDPAKVRAFVRAARQAEALLSDEPDCYGTQAVEGAAHPGDLAQRGNLGALEPYDWQEEGC